MNREINTLTYKDEEINFIELLYYNGPKLFVNMEKRYILAWNKEFQDHDRWFLIKASTQFFSGYTSGKITLLEVMKNSTVEIIERVYDNYELLEIKDTTPNFNDYKLPGDISYLGFDFLSEYNYATTLEKHTRRYTMHIVEKTNSTERPISSHIDMWAKLEVASSQYKTKERYVA